MAAMLAAAAMSPEASSYIRSLRKREAKPPKYPFNEEELAKLESFTNIKEKKKYLKKLKEKYHGQT